MKRTDFITGTRYRNLPAPVREHLSKVVLDTFAALIAGSAVQTTQIIARDFTGIPTILESPEQTDRMQFLGTDWWIGRVYYKFHPCRRWTQDALAGALVLHRRYGLTPGPIASVHIHTFEAATHLSTRRPASTEQAQYSLPYPVACAFARGEFGVREVTELTNPCVLALSNRIKIEVDPEIESRFPAEALARITLQTTGGRELCTGPLPAPGDADSTVTFDNLVQKCRRLVDPIVGENRTPHLIGCVFNCADMPGVEPLVQCLAMGTTP